MFIDSKKAKPVKDYPQVKYPLLYEVTKDGKKHHLLGTFHFAPLNYMPQYVLDIINASYFLITEGVTSMPGNFKTLVSSGPFYENFNCGDYLHDDFKKDIAKILELFSIESNDLNSLSLCFLRFLFGQFISQREVAEKLRMDDKLIKKFKSKTQPNEKNITELATDEIHKIIDHCAEIEKKLKEELPETIHSLLLDTCNQINDYYLSPNNREKNTPLQQEAVSLFLNKNLHELGPHSLDHLFRLGWRAAYEDKNHEWVSIFIKNHESHDHMLLACGFDHLTCPENSIVFLLQKEGFTVSYVQPSFLHGESLKLSPARS